MRPPKYPYLDHAAGKGLLPGEETGIRYWPNPVKGETRHYDQQSAYTTAMRHIRDEGSDGAYCYVSHEYLLRNFPQEIAPGTNSVTHDNAIDREICWKLTLPRHERDDVLQTTGSDERERLYAFSYGRRTCEDVRRARAAPDGQHGVRASGVEDSEDRSQTA